jgi:hypothetical protein
LAIDLRKHKTELEKEKVLTRKNDGAASGAALGPLEVLGESRGDTRPYPVAVLTADPTLAGRRAEKS